jgi:hypothetical protein
MVITISEKEPGTCSHVGINFIKCPQSGLSENSLAIYRHE